MAWSIPALPQSGLARIALTALAGLIAGALFYAALSWIVARWTEGPRQKAAAASAEESAKGLATAAADAVTIINERTTEHVRIEDITRANERAIRGAADAGTPVPGVAGALRAGLCRRAAYHADPACAAMLGDSESLGPARPDDGRPAPGE